MDELPMKVDIEQVRQSLLALGIEDISNVKHVEWEPGRITVERFRRDPAGNVAVVSAYNELATETITMAVN